MGVTWTLDGIATITMTFLLGGGGGGGWISSCVPHWVVCDYQVSIYANGTFTITDRALGSIMVWE